MKIFKIYVDKIPKCCDKCPLKSFDSCIPLDLPVNNFCLDGMILKGCPLKKENDLSNIQKDIDVLLLLEDMLVDAFGKFEIGHIRFDDKQIFYTIQNLNLSLNFFHHKFNKEKKYQVISCMIYLYKNYKLIDLDKFRNSDFTKNDIILDFRLNDGRVSITSYRITSDYSLKYMKDTNSRFFGENERSVLYIKLSDILHLMNS